MTLQWKDRELFFCNLSQPLQLYLLPSTASFVGCSAITKILHHMRNDTSSTCSMLYFKIMNGMDDLFYIHLKVHEDLQLVCCVNKICPSSPISITLRARIMPGPHGVISPEMFFTTKQFPLFSPILIFDNLSGYLSFVMFSKLLV